MQKQGKEKPELNIRTLLNVYEGVLAEYLARELGSSKESEEVKECGEHMGKILRENHRLLTVIDHHCPSALTLEDSAQLIEYYDWVNGLHSVELEQVYRKGCLDCVIYLKELGLL